MGDTESKEQIVRRWIEQLDDRNIGIYDELMSQDAVVHWLGETLSRETAIQTEEDWYRAFPDSRHEILSLTSEGDLVTLEHVLTATHQGTYQGKEPTGAEIEMRARLVYRVDGDMIREIWIERADTTGV